VILYEGGGHRRDTVRFAMALDIAVPNDADPAFAHADRDLSGMKPALRATMIIADETYIAFKPPPHRRISCQIFIVLLTLIIALRVRSLPDAGDAQGALGRNRRRAARKAEPDVLYCCE